VRLEKTIKTLQLHINMREFMHALATKHNAIQMSKSIMASLTLLFAGKVTFSVFDNRVQNQQFQLYPYLNADNEIQKHITDLFEVTDLNNTAIDKTNLLCMLNQLLQFDYLIDVGNQLPIHANYTASCLQSKIYNIITGIQNTTYKVPGHIDIINEICGEINTTMDNIIYNVQQELNLLIIQ
jgi:hypothetical protein